MNAKTTGSGHTTVRVRTIGHDDPKQFEVVVQDAASEIRYQVTMSVVDFERLSGGNAAPEECVRSAFLFLLDREPKESIIRQFDVSVIERYFPEFPREFPCYLDTGPTLS